MNIIFAKATPTGNGALNIIRISGENVKEFVKPLIKKKIIVQKTLYTKIFDLNNICIDYAIVLYFKSPKSLTGEDIIEFHIHGSEQISLKLIKILTILGARMARPGEFLERRYLNGKISLIECELINKKIFYNYESVFKMTIESQKNMFLSIIKNAKFRINLIILSLEFFYFNKKIKNTYIDFIFIKNFLKKYKILLKILYNRIGKVHYFKSLYEIMIMGRRNVGKSTLFNQITTQYDSIITSIPGTTKNIIQKDLIINNKFLKITDTAGLKIKTKNLIEKIGIIKNINNIYNSNIILYLIDYFNLKEIFFNMPINFFKKIKQKELIIIVNKCDIFGKSEGIFKIKNLLIIFLSAKHSNLITNIKCFLSKVIDEYNPLYNEINYSNIKILFESCSIFYKEFNCNYDILISNLIEFQKKIFKMSGNYSNLDIRNSFFKNFCLGK